MMEEEDKLKGVFDQFTPTFDRGLGLGDQADFMLVLKARMQQVEYIKAMQEAQLRRYRQSVRAAVATAAVIAILIGTAILSGSSLFTPLLTGTSTQPVLTDIGRPALLIAGILAVCGGIYYALASLQTLRAAREDRTISKAWGTAD